MLRLCRIVLVHILCAVGFASVGAQAQFSADEAITYFESDVTVNPDSSLLVKETITVNVQGIRIKRGIFRDFPTDYKDRQGNTVRVGFDVVDVKRNGKNESYKIENRFNGKRIRIGNADVFLDKGFHTYTITYRTDRQLGFFEEFDELYWNVTGNGWEFTIENAKTIIRLPAGTQVKQYAAYTGPQGAQGQDFRLTNSSNPITFETTRALRPGEGLTVAVAWPKGVVAAPTDLDQAQYLLKDNAGFFVGMAGLAGLFFYFYTAWSQVGRDPDAGAIIPLYTPPKNISPGASRYTRSMGYDQKAYTAALISMAVKGALIIEEDGSNPVEDAIDSEPDILDSKVGKFIKSLLGTNYVLRRSEQQSSADLSPGERAIFNTLLSSRSSIELKQKNHQVLQRSIKNFQAQLKKECNGIYFESNLGFFAIGAALSLAILGLSSWLSHMPMQTFVTGAASAGLAALVTYVVLKFFGQKLGVTSSNVEGLGNIFGFLVRRLGFVIIGIMFVGSGISTSILSTLSEGQFDPLLALAMSALGVLNVLFYYLLKAPTEVGQQVMEHLEGFRMYLSVTEKDRMNMFNAPGKTPELFEKYLPYALALDVENEWSNQFADVLTKAAQSDSDDSGYRPRWYRGSNWNSSQPQSFVSSLGTSLAGSVASAATAPGSSSGSGGGGSSGGGGGGGGGGGW